MRFQVSTYLSCGVILFSCLLSARSAEAQNIGNCDPPESSAFLDVNNVSAHIHNSDWLFYDEEYFVPKESGITAVRRSNLWVAGKIGGQVRATAYFSGARLYWPGPIDDNGFPPANCKAYDRLFNVTRHDVNRAVSDGVFTPDVIDWPTGLGAPTLDSEGILIDIMSEPLASRKDRRINLEAGELPVLYGDQAIWWVMNDNGNEHPYYDWVPMGIEVHGHAFAFTSPIDAINNSTFYRYKVFNKNSVPIESFYIGLYLDAQLGYGGDDYVGVDTLDNLAFVYNRDNEDGTPPTGYGTPPPALGIQLLEGLPADTDGIDNDHDSLVDEADERYGMSIFGSFHDGGGVNETPHEMRDHYYYMQGRWKDGSQFTIGRNGWNPDSPSTPTRYMYYGDPVKCEYWSLRNLLDEHCSSDEYHQGRLFFSSGPITLLPGASADFMFAVIWAKGKDHLDSITELRHAAHGIRESYKDLMSGERPYLSYYRGGSTSPTPHSMGFDLVYPNPADENGVLRYVVADHAEVIIELYDVLGRPIRTVLQAVKDPGWYTESIDVSDLPSGVYFYRISIGRLSATKPLTVVH